jgi:hypothetical protein
MKIRFPDAGSAADLEVKAPWGADLAGLTEDALARVGVRPRSLYSVRTDRREIHRTRITEFDGSPLTSARAGQVLAALRSALCPGGHDSAEGGSRRSGCYPALSLRDASSRAA